MLNIINALLSSGASVPIKTGFDIPVIGFPVFLRNVANTAEIGTATSFESAATILNNNSGWRSYGIWSGGGGLYCSGTPPQKVIGYKKVGTIFNGSSVSDWSFNDSDITLTQEATGVRIVTTNNNVVHTLTLDAYPVTFLNGVSFEFDVEVLAVPLFKFNVGIAATRICRATYSSSISIQDFQKSQGDFGAGTVGFGPNTYHIRLSTLNDKTTFAVSSSTGAVSHEIECPPGYQEHGIGKFFIEFLQLEAIIKNVKVYIDTYLNTDYIVIGDSSSIRGADTFASSWPQQVVAGKPFAHCVHGDTGFVLWNAAIQEALAVDPARVLIMGSYVDTPAGLSVFQSRYQSIITALKTSPNLQRIYHLATFPNNFGEDIRPFNSWKAATFNTGVDRYIDTYYADLLEGTSGFDLNNAYDWGGSHITQPAHNIVANKIIASL